MSETHKYDVADMIVAALEQKPLDFEAAFNDIIVSKIQTAVEDKKIQIAQQMYGYEEESDEGEEDIVADDEEETLEPSEEEEDGEESN